MKSGRGYGGARRRAAADARSAAGVRVRRRSLAAEKNPRFQVQERGDGQADDVQVVAVDAPHQRRSRTLDGVSAGPLAPLLGRDVPVKNTVVERAERDVRHTDGLTGLAVPS